ncbi:Wzz/FepE/Etk N-terminal domain-containing protein [Thalassotalea montiporae]
MATPNNYEEVSLSSVFSVLWQNKILISFFVLLFAAASVFVAISLPNIYKSQAKLISNKGSDSGLSAIAGNLGGLAGLAGAALGGGSDDSKVQLAKELLKSRVFLKKFVDSRGILVPLIAAEGVDESGQLIINNKLYDQEAKTWVRDVVPPKPVTPSAEDVFQAFESILVVDSDKKTGVVRIELEFYDPKIAQQWLLWLIEDINEEVRQQDMVEAKQSIHYLQTATNKTDSSTMRETFFQLMEEQMKTLLLTEVRKEYVFKTIDPPSFPEEKVSPQRALICIGATIFGAIFIITIVLARHFVFNSKQ